MVIIQAEIVDSTHLELARPLGIDPGKKVFVVVTESADADVERQSWVDGASGSLSRAYGDSDPDYPSSLVREANPRFEA